MPVEVNLLQELFLLLVHILFIHSDVQSRMVTNAAQNRAGPKPCVSDPTDHCGGRRPTKRVYCKRKDVPRELRFLFSKLVWEEEGLSEDELHIILDLYLRFLEMSCKDQNYRIWVKPLKEAKPIFEGLRSGQSKSKGLKNKFLMVDRSITGLILNPHAYFGMKHQSRIGAAKLVSNPPRKRRLPPKRFIGVGYRDKGNLRDKSYDGHPKWQEVASDERVRNSINWAQTDWSASADIPDGIPYGANWNPGTSEGQKSVRTFGRTEVLIIR